MRVLVALIFSSGLTLHAQTFINYRGVVNAASFTPPGLNGSEIAQGSIFSIFGQGIGPVTLAKADSFPLLTNAITMAIQTGGKPCSDPGNPLAPLFAKGGKIGAAILSRNLFLADVDVSQPKKASTDGALVSFRAAPGGALFVNSALSAPPQGTCTIYSGSGRSLTLNIPSFAGGLGTELDAGPSVAISRISAATLARGASPFYTDYLGSDDPSAAASTLVLNTTQPTSLSAPGGPDLGAFQSAVPPSVPPQRAAFAEVAHGVAIYELEFFRYEPRSLCYRDDLTFRMYFERPRRPQC